VAQIQIPRPKAPIDQGATALATFPVPPLEQPPDGWYGRGSDAFRDVSRRLTGPQPQIHQGPTVQATFPVPPVTENPDQWSSPASAAFRDVNVRIASFQARLEGATALATFPVPPINQPPNQWFGPAALVSVDTRRMTGPRPQFDGATRQQTYVFPLSQPEGRMLRYPQAIAETPLETITPGVIPQTYEFTLSQPELSQWRPMLHALRVAVEAPKAVAHYGAAAVSPFSNIFSTAQPELRYFVRLTRPADPVHVQGATIQATHPVPPVSGPPDGWWRGPLATTTVDARRMTGGRPQLESLEQPMSPIPSVTGPAAQWWTGTVSPLTVDGRRMVGPRPQFDGATRQQTYEFFPGQPEFQRFDRRHLNTWQRIGPREQLIGAPVQGYTFTIPVSGPDPSRWSLLVNVRRHGQGLLCPEPGNPISVFVTPDLIVTAQAFVTTVTVRAFAMTVIVPEIETRTEP
jgi:hypothetical protein